MVIRDKSGNPTGKRRLPVTSDSGADIANAWSRNNGHFWQTQDGNDPDTQKPFLLSEIAYGSRSNKKRGQDHSLKNILLKRLQKLRKSNPERAKDQRSKVISDKTVFTAEDVINAIVDLIRVKVKIMANDAGNITLEFNSYEEGEQALEINVAGNTVSYNFWNGNAADQEYSGFTALDRVKIRQLIEKFNAGLTR